MELILNKLDLSEEERNELLPSGTMTTIKSRVGWTGTYLRKAGLLESKKRNYSHITEEGLKVLDENVKVTNDYLLKYNSFRNFFKRNSSKNEIKQSNLKEYVKNTSLTPEEEINQAYEQINKELANNLLDKIYENTPIFFERLVLNLLLKMGYGNFREDAGINTPASNDEGIDGIINQDKLGLEKIGIQAKRYAKDNTIARPQIQSFVGALMGKHLNKGVFITTSSFSTNAIEYAESQVNLSIILIDGETLADLMIEYDVGVSTEVEYKLKRIDNDFFEEL